MAQTGFCDSRPADLHKKTEDKRAPLRTWANACIPKEPRGRLCKTEPERRWVRRLPLTAEDGIIMDYVEQDDATHTDGREDAALLLCLHGLHNLQVLVPSLLHRELELAMEKLGLIYDCTYAWDVFSDMMIGFSFCYCGQPLFKISQLRYSFPSAELPKPFTEATRAILVDWLIQVHDVFHFSEETLYLAIYLLNRALRQIKVSISNLQLLGIVCLFLAAKKEECLLPEISELCYLMENSYSKRQLLRMERKVLCELRFELSHCPPLHFLLLLATIARCSDKVRDLLLGPHPASLWYQLPVHFQVVWMARYLLELSLLEGQCAVFQPAELASAALCLARQVLQEPPTPEGETAWCIAARLLTCSESTLQRIMQVLAVAAARAQGRETRASFLKFSTIETLHVSSHPSLLGAPRLLGLPCPQT